jgi:hypothetical protein
MREISPDDPTAESINGKDPWIRVYATMQLGQVFIRCGKLPMDSYTEDIVDARHFPRNCSTR